MTTAPTDLLKLLGAASGPTPSALAGAATRVVAAAAADAPAFADLLTKAQRGDLSSGMPVSIDSACPVKLDQGQLDRLSRAADVAEAAGIHTAVALIDGMSLQLNVHTRQITGQVDLSAGPITGIDGILPVPAANGAAPALPVRPPSSVLPQNASIAALLEKLANPTSPATNPATQN